MRDHSAKWMRDHVISRDPRDHVPAAQYHRRHRDHRDTRLGERPYPTDDEHRSTCLTGLLGLFVSLSIALSAALYVGYYKIDRGAGGPLFVVARVRGATGGTEISGVVRFWQRPDGGVLISGQVDGLAPHSRHGLSIQAHESGGGAFNPRRTVRHSCPDDDGRRAGELGNLIADDRGTARYERIDRGLTLRGAHSVVGRLLAVHEWEDDCRTQPDGRAGGRVALGAMLVGDPEGAEAQQMSRRAPAPNPVPRRPALLATAHRPPALPPAARRVRRPKHGCSSSNKSNNSSSSKSRSSSSSSSSRVSIPARPFVGRRPSSPATTQTEAPPRRSCRRISCPPTSLPTSSAG